VEIKRNDPALLALLDQVLTITEQPAPPAANPACQYCRWGSATA